MGCGRRGDWLPLSLGAGRWEATISYGGCFANRIQFRGIVGWLDLRGAGAGARRWRAIRKQRNLECGFAADAGINRSAHGNTYRYAHPYRDRHRSGSQGAAGADQSASRYWERDSMGCGRRGDWLPLSLGAGRWEATISYDGCFANRIQFRGAVGWPDLRGAGAGARRWRAIRKQRNLECGFAADAGINRSANADTDRYAD